MTTIRDILNRARWRDAGLHALSLHVVHRGAPGDQRAIPGSRIAGVRAGKSRRPHCRRATMAQQRGRQARTVTKRPDYAKEETDAFVGLRRRNSVYSVSEARLGVLGWAREPGAVALPQQGFAQRAL